MDMRAAKWGASGGFYASGLHGKHDQRQGSEEDNPSSIMLYGSSRWLLIRWLAVRVSSQL
jgi:hypothetical protein